MLNEEEVLCEILKGGMVRKLSCFNNKYLFSIPRVRKERYHASVASVYPEKVLEMYVVGPHCGLTESETLDVGSALYQDLRVILVHAQV